MHERCNVNQLFIHVRSINCFVFNIFLLFPLDVTPTVNPQLTKFCTNLTGITQDMVTNQPALAEVLNRFHAWLKKENLLDRSIRSIFVTCGDWDLYTMLRSQCDYFKLDRPEYFNHWINIKKSFHKATGKFARNGMMGMLQDLGIKHTGRHHSGIDDCQNIAEILKGLVQRGYVFEENRKK